MRNSRRNHQARLRCGRFGGNSRPSRRNLGRLVYRQKFQPSREIRCAANEYRGASSASSVSYETRVERVDLTLEQALNAVATGTLSASEFYRQCPTELQSVLDAKADLQSDKRFSAAPSDVQRNICKEIARAIREPPPPAEELTLLQAFARVAEGKMNGSLLYSQLPGELRTIVDQIAKDLFQSAFGKLSGSQQGQVCNMLGEGIAASQSPPTSAIEQVNPAALSSKPAVQAEATVRRTGKRKKRAARPKVPAAKPPTEPCPPANEPPPQPAALDASPAKSDSVAKSQPQQKVQVLDALRMVRDGKLAGSVMYSKLSNSNRAKLDQISQRLFGKPFSALTSNEQCQLCNSYVHAAEIAKPA